MMPFPLTLILFLPVLIFVFFAAVALISHNHFCKVTQKYG